MSGKKILFWVLAVLIAAAVVFALVKRFAKAPETVTDSPQNAAAEQSKRTDVDPAQLPSHFPVDIAIPGNVKVTQNYSQDSASKLEATRVYETTKSLADEYKYYKDMLTKNGYAIQTQLDQDKVKVLSAQKGGTHLQITIAENTVTRQRTVNISSSEPAK